MSGTVYDPAGRLPLYNVIVYVPNEPLDPIQEGATCDRCSATLSGAPVVTTVTDTHGRFVLENVPVGTSIPLVVQVGKWRRELVLPKVDPCVDTPTQDASIRLPRSQSEGHIPQIALTTGGADPLECLLHKLGLDHTEFTPETGTGRINLFAGRARDGDDVTSRYAANLNGGALFSPATSLWSTLETLMKYDVVMLACEGDEFQADKPATSRQAMFDYINAGGRVFASHWHNYWLEAGPGQFPETATWDHQDDPTDDPFISHIDTTFPKGEALAEWLVNVGASVQEGQMEIRAPQHTVSAVNAAISTRWLYSESPITPGVQYFTFNSPIGTPEEEQCGRVVYTDIHVSAGDEIGPPFPDGCDDGDLSPQEKALLFILFDLSACLTPDDEPPPIPVPQ